MKAPHHMQQWEQTAYEGTTLYATVGLHVKAHRMQQWGPLTQQQCHIPKYSTTKLQELQIMHSVNIFDCILSHLLMSSQLVMHSPAYTVHRIM